MRCWSVGDLYTFYEFFFIFLFIYSLVINLLLGCRNNCPSTALIYHRCLIQVYLNLWLNCISQKLKYKVYFKLDEAIFRLSWTKGSLYCFVFLNNRLWYYSSVLWMLVSAMTVFYPEGLELKWRTWSLRELTGPPSPDDFWSMCWSAAACRRTVLLLLSLHSPRKPCSLPLIIVSTPPASLCSVSCSHHRECWDVSVVLWYSLFWSGPKCSGMFVFFKWGLDCNSGSCMQSQCKEMILVSV